MYAGQDQPGPTGEWTEEKVMNLHHKNCGGEIYIKEWTDYGEEFGSLPDYYCRRCGDFIMGDAQIEEDYDGYTEFGFKHEAL